MRDNDSDSMLEIIYEMESVEKQQCNLPLIFAEMFKNEIDANDEHKMYNGIKRVIKKYSEEKKIMSAINEFTRVISGGASLDEILLIAKDEALHPMMSSVLTRDDGCDRH